MSYSSNHEADNGSNPKFQRIRLKNINMQRYDKPRNIWAVYSIYGWKPVQRFIDGLHIYDCHYFTIYVQDYKIREQ